MAPARDVPACAYSRTGGGNLSRLHPSMSDPYKVPTFQKVLDYLTEYNTRTGSNIGI